MAGIIRPRGARRALRRILTLMLARRPGPARWTAPTFVRELELVRLHLAHLHSRETLVASYGRESFHPVQPVGRDLKRAHELWVDAVRVAYAIRWPELSDGVRRPEWMRLLGAPES
jgi:hypothetical protein